MISRIERLINLIYSHACLWIDKDNDEYYFVDPIDKIEILPHYGTSHFAVATILLGMNNNNVEQLELGLMLLKSYLKRWNQAQESLDFHSDFNNFSLCVLVDELEKSFKEEELQQTLKEVILNTEDSKHFTTNWLPMRMFVNFKKYEWTGLEKFKNNYLSLEEQIKKVTFKDGYIDDRLPIGLSYNLQYNVATVSVMQFLSIREIISSDIAENVGALLEAIQIDGDINYFGRGTNQIFAWGLWFYLLSSSGLKNQMENSLTFFEDKISKALQKNNIFLNDYKGEEKFLWWDYHYVSVYTAHLFFWLVLAKLDYKRKPIHPRLSSFFMLHDSGIKNYMNDFYKITTFSGRKEYLSEKGPMITSLSMNKIGVIFKGGFGPWSSESFGSYYTFDNLTIYNMLGLISVVSYPKKIGRIQKKFLGEKLLKKEGIVLKPLFCDLDISLKDKELEIIFINKKCDKALFNFPIFTDYQDLINMELLVDGKKQYLYDVGILRNQYGFCKVIQSKATLGYEWKLRIIYND